MNTILVSQFQLKNWNFYCGIFKLKSHLKLMTLMWLKSVLRNCKNLGSHAQNNFFCNSIHVFKYFIHKMSQNFSFTWFIFLWMNNATSWFKVLINDQIYYIYSMIKKSIVLIIPPFWLSNFVWQTCVLNYHNYKQLPTLRFSQNINNYDKSTMVMLNPTSQCHSLIYIKNSIEHSILGLDFLQIFMDHDPYKCFTQHLFNKLITIHTSFSQSY